MHDFSSRYLIGVFGIAITAGLLLTLLPHRFADATDTPTAIEHYGKHRLVELGRQTAGGTTGVVMLGDSRLLFGTHPDERFSRDLSSPEQDVSVVRLPVAAATIRDYAELIDHILAANPSLVVVQEDLFERHESRPIPTTSSKDAILWDRFGGDHWHPGEALFPLNDEWSECPPSALNELSPAEGVEVILEAQRLSGMEYLTEGEHIDLLSDLITRAESASIQVAVLAIPESKFASEHIPRLNSEPPGLQLGATAQIDDRLYCYPSHMSPEGRDRYLAQLTPELKALLGSLATSSTSR